MKYTQYALSLFLFILFAIGCNKEEELSNTQMIASNGGKEWITSEMIRDTTGITDAIPSCSLDDVYKFYMDRSYEFLEGDTSCVPGDTLGDLGSWNINEVQTILQIATNGDTTEYIIRELEKNKIKLFYVEQESGHEYLWTLKPR
jgi:hypothetical protein